MGRAWRVVAMVGCFGVLGCGPGEEPPVEAVQGGEGVTIESGPAPEGLPADLPPDIDVIPSNE